MSADSNTLEFLRRPNSVSDLRAEPTTDVPSAPNGQPFPKISAPEPVTAPAQVQAEPEHAPAPVAKDTAPAPPAEMSYADMAAKGPKQAPEDKMPHHIPEIAHEDSAVHSLDSLESFEHSNPIPSYADQQKAKEQADEAAEEASKQARKASQTIDNAATKAGDSAKDFGKKAEAKGEELKKKAGVEGKKAKQEAKEAEEWADKNKGNPVVIGNVVAVAALGGLLGIGAYRKYNAGELTWKVAGAWAGVVGLFAAGDYYVSQWLFKNRYPPKN